MGNATHKKYVITLILLILSVSLISCNRRIKEKIYHNEFVSESKNILEYDTDGEYGISEQVFIVPKDGMNVEFKGKISTDDGDAVIKVISDNDQVLFEQSFGNVNNQKINIKCENLSANSKYKIIFDNTEAKKIKVKLESYDNINFINEYN